MRIAPLSGFPPPRQDVRISFRLFVAGALALAAAACADPTRLADAPRTARILVPPPSPAQQIVPDEYIVVLRPGAAGVSAVANKARQLGGNVLAEWSDALNGFWVELPAQALNALASNPNIDWIEPNGIATTSGTETCAAGYAGCSWGLDRIDQQSSALDLKFNYPSNLAANVHVYILDTGLRITHTEFGGRASYGYDYIDNDAIADDCNGHGTHVAGTIGGATYGVAKGALLIGVRVLNCSGSGTWAQIISGINWVTGHAIKPAVASMSLGGGANSSVDQAVTNSVAAGITYAIAAGNSNADACLYSPARTASAITVAATGGSGIPAVPVDQRASYSNFGTCVDIFAPGTNITSSWNSSNTATNTISGTSMATPHVSGAAALFLAQNTTATPSQVTAALVNNSTSGVVTSAGTGSPNKLLYTGFLNGSSPPQPPPTSYTVNAWATVATCYERPGTPHSCLVTGEVRDNLGNLIGGALTLTGFSTSDTTAAAYFRSPSTGILEVTNFTGTPWKPGPLTITAYYVSGGVTYRSSGVLLTLMPAPGSTCTLTLAANPLAGGTPSFTSGSASGTCGRTVQVAANVNSGWRFVNWSDGSTASARSVTVSQTTQTLTANYVQLCTLTVAASPSGGGTVSPSAPTTVDCGTAVSNVTATPNTSTSPPWSFVSWSDASTQNPRSVTVSQVNQTLTATFQQQQPSPPTYTVNAWALVATCYQRPGTPHSCHVTGEVRDGNGNLVGGALKLTGFSTSDTTAAAYWRNPTTGALEVTNYTGTPWKPGTVTITAYFTSGGVVYRSGGVALTLLPYP